MHRVSVELKRQNTNNSGSQHRSQPRGPREEPSMWITSEFRMGLRRIHCVKMGPESAVYESALQRVGSFKRAWTSRSLTSGSALHHGTAGA